VEITAMHILNQLLWLREAISNIRTVAAFGAEDRISIQFMSKLNKPNKQALLRGYISSFGYGVT
jgi:ATP-binding cassette subfamily B (MDR/TAP) protein 1